ncbi:hypothetical protein GPX89_25850 [Nocardia sp. ET3-3]|uniref:Uncharacterized protein n=1 Tax=Nocardia terrae TaxID=2675851 RepID=A0A7K1V2E2_9NOCA|nr:hypothetical protein [Nocardia terrae]MVU80662.1 hypothetical protein [Nocardia terrae]
MDIDEAQEIRIVSQLLADCNPRIPETVVAITVDEALRKFDGCPIRDFVPLLVQRIAARKLAEYPDDD